MTKESYCECNEVIFQERELPYKIRGFSYHDDEGRFIVVLNSRLGILMNRKTAGHELRHIMRNEHENKNYLEYQEEAGL